MDLDRIAFLQAECLDDAPGKTNRQAVPHFATRMRAS
jgi:hypothetical protein